MISRPSTPDSAPPPATERRIVDVRPAAAFAGGHLAGAVSHPVPAPPPGADADAHFAAALPSIFLPPREVPLLVVAPEQGLARDLAAHLADRGRAPVEGLAVAELPPQDLAATGPEQGRLWSPPPWLESHQDLLPPPPVGPVLDLACGSGRAAVWLARRGYRVTGVDWQPEALAFGAQLAASERVVVKWREADLRHPVAGLEGPWAVVLNFRFLQRDLLGGLGARVRPGGVAVLRTFRDTPGYAGHPHPRHRLGPGELLRHFPSGQWEILAHEESHDPDGRPAAGIVARRRS